MCECGCGQRTRVAVKTSAKFGHIKGRPLRFIHGHNQGTPVAGRFWDKVKPAPAFDCWEWTATKDKGYGRVSVGGVPKGAHRVAWEILRGPIPPGLTIEHECKNPGCVNPWHMDLWPQWKNSAGATNQNVEKTHCVRDHEFTPENTRTLPPLAPGRSPRRSCRKCENIRTQERRARARRELLPA